MVVLDENSIEFEVKLLKLQKKKKITVHDRFAILRGEKTLEETLKKK